jgi:hypothetical protein
MSAEDVANAFVAHYYQLADTNVDGLGNLFVRFVWHDLLIVRYSRLLSRLLTFCCFDPSTKILLGSAHARAWTPSNLQNALYCAIDTTMAFLYAATQFHDDL